MCKDRCRHEAVWQGETQEELPQWAYVPSSVPSSEPSGVPVRCGKLHRELWIYCSSLYQDRADCNVAKCSS